MIAVARLVEVRSLVAVRSWPNSSSAQGHLVIEMEEVFAGSSK